MTLKVKNKQTTLKAEEEQCNFPVLGLGETIKGLRTKTS